MNLSGQSDFEVLSVRLPNHAAAIEQMWHEPDFQELCEHLAHMCRLEEEVRGDTKRIIELRKSLEKELLELLSRKSFHSNQREKNNETTNET